MVKSKFENVKISGISMVVPDYVKSIDDDLEYFDNNPQKLARTKKIVGFGTRYVAPENCTTVDLCEAAARKLIDDMKIDVNELDAVVFVLQKPDYSEPGSACVVHGRLGLPKTCAAMDINHGCTGYVYGLWTVSSMIQSGACRKVLMLAGDKPTSMSRTNRITEPVFGDAGSATLIEYSEKGTPSYFDMGADGTGYEAIIIPSSGERLPVDKDILDLTVVDEKGTPWKLNRTYMNGMEVFNFTINEVPANMQRVMAYADVTADSLDFAVLHQANKQIVETVASKAGFPAEKYSAETFSTYGNQSTASIPGVICHLLKDKVSNGKQRLMLSAFGIGLAWGAAIVELDHIYCSGIVARKFDHLRTREEEITYWINKIKG